SGRWARRAAVADEVEAEPLEVGEEPRGVEVAGHDLRARREARLDPWPHAEPAGRRLAGEESRGEHDRRVRRVRAAGDRRDHDRAVTQLAALAAHLDGHAAALGRRVLDELLERLAPGGLGAAERHSVLRTPGAGEARLDGAEVELQVVAELGLGHGG